MLIESHNSHLISEGVRHLSSAIYGLGIKSEGETLYKLYFTSDSEFFVKETQLTGYQVHSGN